MGNQLTREVVLNKDDVLYNICAFDDGSNAYRWRQICKRCREAIDKHRPVSTLVFPSALVEVKRPVKGTKTISDGHNSPATQSDNTKPHCNLLPHPCWGIKGEFSCLQNRVGGRALTKYPGLLKSHTDGCPFKPLENELAMDNRFIPVARLGAYWEPCRVSVPGWLVQGVSSGKIKCLDYDATPYKSGTTSYEVVLYTKFYGLSEVFDEIKMQRKAVETRPEGQRLMGLVDCLALWMHPAVFTSLEELHVVGDDMGMECPSQMYKGIKRTVTNGLHWSCWTEYACSVLTSLLSLNGAACGLKKLHLAGESGRLVANILFHQLKIDMPALTHLKVDRTVAPMIKGDSPSLHQVSFVDAECLWEDLGKLPSLNTLQLARPSEELNLSLNEFLGKGLFLKLQKLVCQEQLFHGDGNHPGDDPLWKIVRNSRVPWDLPCRRFVPRLSGIPVGEDCLITTAFFPRFFYEYDDDEYYDHDMHTIALPRSTRKVVIEVSGDYYITVPKLQFPANFRLEELVFQFSRGFTVDKASQKFTQFRNEAGLSNPLFLASKIVLEGIMCPPTPKPTFKLGLIQRWLNSLI